VCGLYYQHFIYVPHSGFFASKAGLFDLAKIDAAASRAFDIRAHMELGAYEQSFVNFLVVSSGCRYTSLSRLVAETPESDLPCECWPGDSNWQVNSRREMLYQGRRKPVLFIHWAGCWWPTRWEKRMERWAIKLGFKIEPATVRYRLRFKKLWRHYRDLGAARAH
jgi:hypothetical protein